jgi:hypothetical protein
MVSHLLWEQGFAGSSPVWVTFRGLAEWSIASVLKTEVVKATIRSNRIPSIFWWYVPWGDGRL